MTPELGTAAKLLDHMAENESAPVKIIQITKEGLARGGATFIANEEDEGEFFRRVTPEGKLDAGRTVRSGYAYDFDSTDAVDPAVAARAAGIKAELGDEPLHDIEARYAYRFVKRTFDIAFSAAVIVLFSWLFIIVAIAVKVDDPKGPIFFKQSRVGPAGEFKMLKFRSMCVDAEEKLADLKELNEKSGPVFKIADDPRITRVGKVIRKLSLDELPQFFNVLIGDMSVVGPRPALPNEVKTYTDYQRQRLLVRGGIAWDIIAPKPGAGEKSIREHVSLPAYEGARFGVVAA